MEIKSRYANEEGKNANRFWGASPCRFFPPLKSCSGNRYVGLKLPNILHATLFGANDGERKKKTQEYPGSQSKEIVSGHPTPNKKSHF